MRRFVWILVLVAAAALGARQAAIAATPGQGTISVDAQGNGSTVKWTGSVHPGSESGSQDQGAGCFGSDNKPADSTTTGCDIFTLDANVPSGFYQNFIGGPQLKIANFGGSAPDLDMYIYRRNADGTADLSSLAGSAATESDPEQTTIPKGSGGYYVAIVPFATGPTQSYDGEAKFVVKPRPSITDVNARAPEGAVNYRASHDSRVSHSEPTIAMDPLNHDHLMAGSKMYDSLPKYLFKIGAYESFDGGKTWHDWDQLPGYCPTAPECDPSQPTKYHVTSDISMTFDDEGNAYAFVLDSPGGTSSPSGWGMSLNIKQPGKPWSQPITVHSNAANPLTQALFLDDKNWLAVDNNHLPDGSPNKPNDGKIGPLYTCWGLDQGSTIPAPAAGQSIVFMRSTDGGHTWGGTTPGDNTPLPISQKGAISGIGCHIIVDPTGAVYVTWYDNQLDAIMQVKSTDFGQTFTPARPIATITGQNSSFPGQAFRNLSIPTTGVDSKGNVYVAVDSQNGTGAPVVGSAAEVAQQLLQEGNLDKQKLRELVQQSGESVQPEHQQDGGSAPVCPSADTTQAPCTDVILFKSTDGGTTYSTPVRVNQDDPHSAADQFQPWMAITPKGQLDISYFDRRNDPTNYFIDTYLSRSNDGGKTFTDTRVTHSVWDPEINPPISPSGQFIGDYQGIVADDNVAIPFWNDTQYANLPKSAPEYSPYQEVSAARIPNSAPLGGPGATPGEPSAPPVVCSVGAGLKSAAARPFKRGVRFTFQRSAAKPVAVRVYLQTRGRRIIQSQLVARFPNRTKSFAWNGRANIAGRRVTDGYYVAKLEVPVGRGSDLRQLALLRRGGRFKSLPPFVRTPCAALSSFGLNRPIFGGSNNRSLVVYYQLHRQSRVTVTLNLGTRVVRRFRTPIQAQGPYKLRIPARGVRAGSYQVILTASASDGTKTRATVTARRL
jgi:hypothetical protein